MADDPMIAALLREREGLEQQGNDERVAQVDEQLALHGYTPPAGEAPSRSTPPKARRTRRTEAT